MYKLKKQFVKYWILCRDFGIEIAMAEMILRILGVFFKEGNLWKKAYKYKNLLLERKMNIFFSHIIEIYKNKDCMVSSIPDDAPIWIYWAQGIDNAPNIVKQCAASVRRNSGIRPVNVICFNDIKKYVTIPQYIISKYNEGVISQPHFADILRFSLLRKYGGIWVDATVYISGSNTFRALSLYPFYSIKHNIGSDYLACKGLWSTFFLASSSQSILVDFVYDCLLEYWKKNKSVIDYLFLDIILEIGYANIAAIHKIINMYPANNTGVFELMKRILENGNVADVESILSSNCIHKLTYKYKIDESEGSIYQKIFNDNY